MKILLTAANTFCIPE